MQINLSKEEVVKYSEQYDYEGDDLMASLIGEAKKQGFVERRALETLADWKWPAGQTRKLVKQNSEGDVQEITRVAFSTENERLRVGALRALRGVDWPMASVILHFAFPDRYPVLDRRTMEVVDGSTSYNFERWMEYAEICRKASKNMGVSLRTLDRALWVAGGRKPRANK